MIQSETIFTKTRQTLNLALLVLPHCSILEVASTLDPLRAANRHLGYEAYRWRILSPDGQTIPLTCGIALPSSGTLQDAQGADVLIIIAGYRQSEVATKPLLHILRRMAPLFTAIGGIDAGGWVLARAGLLDGHKATVHWEDLEDFATNHPDIDVLPDRYVISGPRFTAAGASPACELMLHLIRTRQGAGMALQVGASFLTTPLPAHTPQITQTRPHHHLDARIIKVIARIEAQLDNPVSTADLAAGVHLSPRRLEQLFKHDLGQTPAAYALKLRLAAAHRMLCDTRHPMTEIALRCGFGGAATLSRAYARHYGHAPRQTRKNSLKAG